MWGDKVHPFKSWTYNSKQCLVFRAQYYKIYRRRRSYVPRKIGRS
jgi:hypothetical protein